MAPYSPDFLVHQLVQESAVAPRVIRYVLVVGGRSAESLDERIRAWPKGYDGVCAASDRLWVGHRVSRKKSDLLSRQSSVDISPELPAVSRRRSRSHGTADSGRLDDGCNVAERHAARQPKPATRRCCSCSRSVGDGEGECYGLSCMRRQRAGADASERASDGKQLVRSQSAGCGGRDLTYKDQQTRRPRAKSGYTFSRVL